MRRIGCLLTLVVCLAFWALVAFVAINVIAASSEAQVPGSVAGFIGPGLRGTPHVGEAAVVAVASRNAGVPTPEQARTEALGAMVEGEIGTVLLGGWATWFDDGPGLYAAAGPVLRDVLGEDWRGQRVTVCADACVRVVLSDWCACGERHGDPTLLDLSPAAFRRLAPLSAGVVRVSIEYGGPRMTPPPTDQEEMP